MTKASAGCPSGACGVGELGSATKRLFSGRTTATMSAMSIAIVIGVTSACTVAVSFATRSRKAAASLFFADGASSPASSSPPEPGRPSSLSLVSSGSCEGPASSSASKSSSSVSSSVFLRLRKLRKFANDLSQRCELNRSCSRTDFLTSLISRSGPAKSLEMRAWPPNGKRHSFA